MDASGSKIFMEEFFEGYLFGLSQGVDLAVDRFEVGCEFNHMVPGTLFG